MSSLPMLIGWRLASRDADKAGDWFPRPLQPLPDPEVRGGGEQVS